MGSVYRTAQLEKLGVTKHRREKLLEEGRLHRIAQGLYSTAPASAETLLCAFRITRPHLVYAGPTARQIHDRQPVGLPLHALVQRPQSYRSTGQLRVKQVRTLPFRRVDGHRVVLPVAAVGDLLDSDPHTARSFLEHHYAGRDGNASLAADLSRLGRVSPALRTLIASASIASDSRSEQKLARALKSEGVEVIQNVLLGHYHWDYVIPAARILIELDSHRYHAALPGGANERTFIVDRWKANDGARRGWLVLRYTGDCVYRHLDKIVAQVVDTIRWRQADGGPDTTFVPELLPFEVQPPWSWHFTLRAGNLVEPPWTEE